MKKSRTSIQAIWEPCCILKFLRILKLTTMLLLMTTLQVLAGINTDSNRHQLAGLASGP